MGILRVCMYVTIICEYSLHCLFFAPWNKQCKLYFNVLFKFSSSLTCRYFRLVSTWRLSLASGQNHAQLGRLFLVSVSPPVRFEGGKNCVFLDERFLTFSVVYRSGAAFPCGFTCVYFSATLSWREPKKLFPLNQFLSDYKPKLMNEWMKWGALTRPSRAQENTAGRTRQLKYNFKWLTVGVYFFGNASPQRGYIVSITWHSKMSQKEQSDKTDRELIPKPTPFVCY